jgi:protein gp37
MADQTKIEWTDSTFSPWIGCTKISPACDHCYAEALMDTRMGKAQWGSGKPRVRTSAANWRKPVQWDNKRFMECGECGWRGECDAELIGCGACGSSFSMNDTRRRVFCASLADVFDNEVPVEWLVDLLDLIRRTPNLDWLLLSKRVGNWRSRLVQAVQYLLDAGVGLRQVGAMIHKWLAHGEAPANVWMLATICNQAEADRDIPKLLEIPARIRGVSIEPMLGPVDFRKVPGFNKAGSIGADLVRNFWVIAGGESGPGARPMHPDWVRSLRDQCAAAGVPFLFKQWGAWWPGEQGRLYREHTIDFSDGQPMVRVGKLSAGRTIDGRTHTEFPS